MFRPYLQIHFAILAVVCCLVPTVGCGGAFDARVQGVITLDGTPLPRGTVTFTPTSTEGSTAYGRLQSDGSYYLQIGRERGLKPGDYKVTVVAREAAASDYGKDGGPPPPGKQITPDWYKSVTSSGLSYTVEPGSNQIDIELTTTPPPGWRPQRSRRR